MMLKAVEIGTILLQANIHCERSEQLDESELLKRSRYYHQ